MNEPDSCYHCGGSGEGAYDGSICYHCKGRGVMIDLEQQREIAEAKAEYEFELWKEARYGY